MCVSGVGWVTESSTHSIRSKTLIHNSSAVALCGAIFVEQNRLAVLCLKFNTLRSRKKGTKLSLAGTFSKVAFLYLLGTNMHILGTICAFKTLR